MNVNWTRQQESPVWNRSQKDRMSHLSLLKKLQGSTIPANIHYKTCLSLHNLTKLQLICFWATEQDDRTGLTCPCIAEQNYHTPLPLSNWTRWQDSDSSVLIWLKNVQVSSVFEQLKMITWQDSPVLAWLNKSTILTCSLIKSPTHKRLKGMLNLILYNRTIHAQTFRVHPCFKQQTVHPLGPRLPVNARTFALPRYPWLPGSGH